MKIFDGSVIVWTKDGGTLFNNIDEADAFFDEALERNENPCWQRIFKSKEAKKYENI